MKRRAQLAGASAIAALTAWMGVAPSALAATTTTHATTVNMTVALGSRQFFVEDLSGNDLASVSIARIGGQPFRVRVADNVFSTVAQNYQLSATMNNLYLSNGAGGYTWATKVPSSALAINFATNPLQASGVNFALTPLYTLAGTVTSCAALQTANPTTLGGLTTNPLATPLCTLLGTAGQTVTSLTVSEGGFTRTLAPTISNVATDLPVQLTGATGGTFTNPDYVNGIGAGDTTKPATPPAATSVSLMTGTAGLSSQLTTAITNLLPPVATTAVASATDTASAALMPLANALTALTASTNATVAQLGSDIAALNNAGQEAAIVNTLTASLVPLALSQLGSVTGNYSSYPVLQSNAAAPQSGTYSGTMTVTFVQTP